MENLKRLEWLDIAKSIAIILMVLGHTSIPLWMSNFIYAFHMPLFFIASGWTTNWEKYSIGNFIIHRFKTLLIPFIIYSMIVLAVMIFHGWNTIGDWITKGWGDGYALWFIPVLFLASLLAKGLYTFRETGGGRLFGLLVLLMLCMGIDLFHYHIRLPWNLSTVPYGVFMIVLGSEWANIYNRDKSNKIQLLMMVVAALVVGTISHFWRMDLCFNRILPSLPLTVGAIAGTYIIFSLSRWIEGSSNNFAILAKKVLSIIGRETYIIVAFSPIIIMIINNYWALNPIIKYVLLVVILVILGFIKNIMKKLWKSVVKC